MTWSTICPIPAAKQDYLQVGCFVCVLLSHFTEDDKIVGVNGATLELYDIFDKFKGDNCTTLVGKPKIFLMEVSSGGVC